jgi:hypothetical protein
MLLIRTEKYELWLWLDNILQAAQPRTQGFLLPRLDGQRKRSVLQPDWLMILNVIIQNMWE